MKRSTIAWGLIALTFLAGCVPSVNPVYLPEDLVFEESVLGTWAQMDKSTRWKLSQRDATSYDLVYTDEAGVQGRFIAHLAKIEGNLFLDLYPHEVPPEGNKFYQLHLTPTHTIYLVKQLEPTLKLAAIDLAWLDKELSQQPAKIASSVCEKRRVITAPTEKVRAFVVKNKDKFTAKLELERVADVQ